MDLNYLYSRHQISLITAHAAACSEARVFQLKVAELYGTQIDRLRRQKGAIGRSVFL